MNLLNVCVIITIIILGYLLFKKWRKTSTSKIFEMFDKPNPVINELVEEVSKVYPPCKELKIVEGDQSYTLNKKKVFLCLKDKRTGKTYDKNMLIYVLLHELAHVLNKDDVGHTPAFHAEFDKLLAIAEEKGIFDPSIPLEEDYCPK
jgi:hypothetical protein